MTTRGPVRLSTQGAPPDAADTADVLKRLQDSALGLLAGLDRPPRSIRIKADQVEVEVQWPDQDPAAAPPAGAAPSAPDAPAHGAVDTTEQYITAHMVGTFYRCPEPGAEPFVEPGGVVEHGQQVGIIEAMKLMVPVEADVPGRIVEVLVSNGAAVEYGDRLFAVAPVDG